MYMYYICEFSDSADAVSRILFTRCYMPRKFIFRAWFLVLEWYMTGSRRVQSSKKASRQCTYWEEYEGVVKEDVATCSCQCLAVQQQSQSLPSESQSMTVHPWNCTELQRRQSRHTDPLLLIYSFQFRSAFHATTTPSQPRALDTVACVDHAQPAADKAPTSVVTDNLVKLIAV